MAVHCGPSRDPADPPEQLTTLREGAAQLSATSPINGLRQLSLNLSVESLARTGPDGRMQPWLAESWTIGHDGRSLVIKLRPNVKFHDGTALDAAAVAALLPESLRSSQGPAFENVERITATAPDVVEILLKEPSPFSIEALEASIQKPGPGSTRIGTGAFMVPENATELRANPNYYLGRPSIDRITVVNYPNVRSAWAELLRNNLDMLYEVGPDAVSSLEGSSTISLFWYTRNYQHTLALNTRAPSLHSKEIRRALNLGIDRQALVKTALNGYGVASSTPVAHHWAVAGSSPPFTYDPQQAVALLKRATGTKALSFTCLVAPNSLDERIALEAKRQLSMLGVDMKVEEASRDEIVRRGGAGDYEAAMLDFINGPTIIRPYMSWHSGAPLNWGHFGSATVDAALDRARNAPNDDQYRDAVVNLQQAFVDDPPAIFLAWSVRARAVSKRFVVPAVEPDRDVLATLRLWRPGADNRNATQH